MILPKRLTYAQLNGLADPQGCSLWNPTSWGVCSTWVIQARTELANAHNQIIDLANGWQERIDAIEAWPDSENKATALADAQNRFNDAYSLVQQHTQVQNDFEQTIQPYVNVGLAGIGKNGLGVLPVWALATVGSLAIAGLLAWGITSAAALKSNYDSQAAYYNQFSEYYKTCQELAQQGKPCNVQGPSTTGPGTAWAASASTILLLGGLGLLLVMGMRR
jgi:hypothetical protein